jgi:hypothetical protein
VADHHAPLGFHGTLEQLGDIVGNESARRWTGTSCFVRSKNSSALGQLTWATAIFSPSGDEPRRRADVGARRAVTLTRYGDESG